MKKVFMLATAAFLFTGIAFANGGDGKKCSKDCCKGGKECCKKDEKKDAKAETKTTAKAATKKA